MAEITDKAADVLEVLRREGVELPPDHLEDAQDFLLEGLTLMKEKTSGLDPAQWAPTLAMQAALYYAAHKLAPGGVSQKMYSEHQAHYQQWKRKGRIAQARANRRKDGGEATTIYDDYVKDADATPRDRLRVYKD